jgi:hypothetical protein
MTAETEVLIAKGELATLQKQIDAKRKELDQIEAGISRIRSMIAGAPSEKEQSK